MNFTRLELPDLVLIEPKVFEDDRGYFYESFNRKKFAKGIGVDPDFVQDNHSYSRRGVLRGLHYQIRQTQGKLVRVVQGRVFDVAVDLRRTSPTFGRWAGVELSSENKRMLWVPPGFAHGFVTLSEVADFLYKTTDYYSPADERCIFWNDPRIGISWPINFDPIVAQKDANGDLLCDAELFP